jgi:hypothetical protein
MTVGESVMNGALRDTRCTPGCIVALPGMGALPGGRSISPLLVGPKWMPKTLPFRKRRAPSREPPDRDLWRASDQENSKARGLQKGHLGGNQALSLEGLAEKVGTLGLQRRKKNR